MESKKRARGDNERAKGRMIKEPRVGQSASNARRSSRLVLRMHQLNRKLNSEHRRHACPAFIYYASVFVHEDKHHRHDGTTARKPGTVRGRALYAIYHSG